MTTAKTAKPKADKIPIMDRVLDDPSIVLTDSDAHDEYIAELQKRAKAVKVDLSTDKGRKAVASAAFKVAQQKSMIDKAGIKLNEDARAQISKMNAVRTDVKTTLEIIQAEIRKPLNDWQKQEDARIEWCKNLIASLEEAGTILHEDTSETIAARLEKTKAIAVSETELQDFYDSADRQKRAAIQALSSILPNLQQQEKDQAELAVLRAKQAEQDRLNAERIAAEQAAAAKAEREKEQAEMEAKAAETARLAAEQKAADDLAAQEQAAETARIAAEQAAADALAERERAHQEALDRVKQEKLDADRRRVEEQERVEAERKEIEAQELKRQANTKHRNAVMAKAGRALVKHCNVEADEASKIVVAIHLGQIPGVTISF